MLLISVAEDSGSSACYKTLEIVTGCAFFLLLLLFIIGVHVWWVSAGTCVPGHLCGRQRNWSPLLLWDPSPRFSTFHHLETLRVFVFSLACTAWEGRLNTVFSSPLPGPGSKYLDSKRLLFTPVSHLVGFAGDPREHEGLIALGFSSVSPVRHGVS